MNSGNDVEASLDDVSMHSLNFDTASESSSTLDGQIDEALVASVLQILDSPEQMAALGDADKARVMRMAQRHFSQNQTDDDIVAAGTDDTSSAGVEAEESNFGTVTQEASLALSMRLLHQEMGDAMLVDMPRSALFDIVRSIGKVVCGSDELRATLVELLDCSAATNIVQRLQAWPACHEQLQDSAARSEFHRLFTAAMHELSERAGGPERQPDTSEGEYRLGQCDICCSEADKLLWLSGCCETSVCVSCLHRWLMDHLTEVRTKLGCPGCSTVLTVPQLRYLLSVSDFDRREQLLARQRGGSSNERDCPRCSCLAQRPRRQRRVRTHRAQKELGGVTVTCAQCDYVWCFDCHSPAHPGLSCRKFRSGVHMVEDWAKQVEQSGLRKARRCPKCKAMIEKNDGCNHMTCAQCHHEFCYLCSKRWRVRQLKIPFLHWSVFGSHSSKLSVFGCREKFLPDKPVLRRLIRGSLFVLRVLALIAAPPAALAIAVALVGIAIPLSPLLIPAIVGLYCLYKIQRSAVPD